MYRTLIQDYGASVIAMYVINSSDYDLSVYDASFLYCDYDVSVIVVCDGHDIRNSYTVTMTRLSY